MGNTNRRISGGLGSVKWVYLEMGDPAMTGWLSFWFPFTTYQEQGSEPPKIDTHKCRNRGTLKRHKEPLSVLLPGPSQRNQILLIQGKRKATNEQNSQAKHSSQLNTCSDFHGKERASVFGWLTLKGNPFPPPQKKALAPLG